MVNYGKLSLYGNGQDGVMAMNYDNKSSEGEPLGLMRIALIGLGVAFVLYIALAVNPPESAGRLYAITPLHGEKTSFWGYAPRDVSDLESVVSAIWEEPRYDVVPSVAPLAFPKDIDSIASSTRKKLFVRSLLPHILRVNEGILERREKVEAVAEAIAEGKTPTRSQRSFLLESARRYRIKVEDDGAVNYKALIKRLLKRIDVIPPSLAIAQAAIESAWGASRFAQEGNNLFGQWVFSQNAGMAPRDAAEDANYSVARYTNIAESVESYARNLNTLWAYNDLREERQKLRDAGLIADGPQLAKGLLLYSVRREAYVKEVRAVIRQNKLTLLDHFELTPVERAELMELMGEADELDFRPLAKAQNV
ncbi:MAG: hypothetical protein C0609_00910 [Deltaproteobacteria bacterium]|nr:MAG: hypothetical protein C0609_00910 [Deltaproteobacteria bacterium]